MCFVYLRTERTSIDTVCEYFLYLSSIKIVGAYKFFLFVFLSFSFLFFFYTRCHVPWGIRLVGFHFKLSLKFQPRKMFKRRLIFVRLNRTMDRWIDETIFMTSPNSRMNLTNAFANISISVNLRRRSLFPVLPTSPFNN